VLGLEELIGGLLDKWRLEPFILVPYPFYLLFSHIQQSTKILVVVHFVTQGLAWLKNLLLHGC